LSCITAKLRNKRPAHTRQQAQLRHLKISLHKPCFFILISDKCNEPGINVLQDFKYFMTMH